MMSQQLCEAFRTLVRSGARGMALTLLVVMAPAAWSQEPQAQLPPVVRAISEKETLPADGVFDVLGLRLGMTYEEAVIALTKLNYGQDVRPKARSYMQMSDSRGNSFAFTYESKLHAMYENAEHARETIELTFTTNINESRLASISRKVMYSDPRDKQPSIPDLTEALKAKYGPPSWSESKSLTILNWFWIKGKRQTVTKIDGVLDCLQPPLAPAFPYRIPQRGPDCSPLMKVTMHPGASADRMYAVSFELVDLERLRHNTKDTDAWVEGELQKVIKGKAAPSGPKL